MNSTNPRVLKQISKSKQGDSKLIVSVMQDMDLPRVDVQFDQDKLLQVQNYNTEQKKRLNKINQSLLTSRTLSEDSTDASEPCNKK